MSKPINIEDVRISTDYKEGDIDLDWVSLGIGYGHVAFYEKEGKIFCHNEQMSKDFVKAVLCKLVDVAVFTEL